MKVRMIIIYTNTGQDVGFHQMDTYISQRKFIAPVLTALFLCAGARADTPVFELVIKDHQFHPPRLEVPVGTRVKLAVHNQDPTPEEFESYELNREKVIMGNSKVTVFVGPLRAGEYPFFGEFNQKTAQGILVAVED